MTVLCAETADAVLYGQSPGFPMLALDCAFRVDSPLFSFPSLACIAVFSCINSKMTRDTAVCRMIKD